MGWRASTAADSAAAVRRSFASTRAMDRRSSSATLNATASSKTASMGDGAVVEEDGRIGARARGAAGSSPAIHTLALAHELATMMELPRGALSSSVPCS